MFGCYGRFPSAASDFGGRYPGSAISRFGLFVFVAESPVSGGGGPVPLVSVRGPDAWFVLELVGLLGLDFSLLRRRVLGKLPRSASGCKA